MAVLSGHFQKFHANISLDATRVGRIQAAHTTLRRIVRSDGPLSEVLHDVFLQGSFKNNTAIRPVKDEFDVDVALAIDATDPDSWLSVKRDPDEVLNWVARRLREQPHYQSHGITVRRRRRCVRLVYEGDFHLDVIPAHSNGDLNKPLEVPDRAVSRWIWSHPKGYTEWCEKVNKRTNGKFTRVTKMLKWWCRREFDPRRAPRSIVFQTLIGTHMPANPASDAEALVCTLENLNEWLRSRLVLFSAPSVDNPSLPGEDLARDWDLEDYKLFKQRVESAVKKACEAFLEGNTERSARLWRELFGDAFPLTL